MNGGRRTDAEDPIWFDDGTFADDHPTHAGYSGAPEVDPDGEFELDELDPAATEARWWGR